MTAWLQRRVRDNVIEWQPLGDVSYLGSAPAGAPRGRPRAGRQCVIVREGSIYRLRDLASRWGTLVNYRYVREAVLVPGDVIQVGSALYSFHRLEQPAADLRRRRLR